jgi:hypothetical protein
LAAALGRVFPVGMSDNEDDTNVSGFRMQRPKHSYIPKFSDEHLESLKEKTIPANFDKTCIVLVENAAFYNPERKQADGIVVSIFGCGKHVLSPMSTPT